MAAETAERSPSPAPSAPIASAPGPRASALQKLYGDAISHVLKTCSYTNFAACFPTPAKHVGESLKALHEQFTTKLGENAHREFGVICEERNVVPSLNALDGLVEEARRRQERAKEEGKGDEIPVPPHTLPPQALYQSHLAPSLGELSSTLTTQQAAVEAENKAILERVLQQRKQIAALVGGLDNVVADLDASVAALNEENAGVEDARDQVRDVEDHMRMEV